MARLARGLVRWTLWLSEAARDEIRAHAEAVSEETGRRIKQSAVGRALIEEALEDPAMVARARTRAAAEPPSGVARKVEVAEDTVTG
jgi:hypothetical protein